MFKNKFRLDDILFIIRPFVYMISIVKYGKKSYEPIKIALAIDVSSIILSIIRIIKSNNCKAL